MQVDIMAGESVGSMLRVDLHTHTADDPWDRIPHTSAELIERAAQLGLDALAITLHDRQLDLTPLAGLARKMNITLIPGIERTILGRHVLLLNFPAEASSVCSFEQLAEVKALHPRGLVVAPHPFFPLGNCLGELLDRHRGLFDAVEYNGSHTSMLNFNRRAVQWAKLHGKPVVGCSDTHRLDVLGNTYSLVDAARTADDICAAVREGRVQVCSRPLSPLKLASYLARMILGGHRQPATPNLPAH
jgi:predicted metal-dependent phosphoesterase TrpH